MKVKISLKIYKDKPLWYTLANDSVLVDLSNKNDPEAIAHEAEKLFLNLLKEIRTNDQKNKTKKEVNGSGSERCSKEAVSPFETEDKS